MKVELTIDFLVTLEEQIEFISLDKPSAAQKFKNDLFKLLFDIPKMPLKNRKSIYFDDDSIRDLIFKGYTVVYEIDMKEDKVVVFAFLKYQEKL